MPSLTGQSLGRYHLLEPLGEGGMAVVYKAYDTRLETDVAVKVIRTETLPQNAIERALKRFEREAKALAKLTHPNIVKVTDYGEFEGRPYLVMPYLPGGTLKQKLKGKPVPWQEAARLLVPVARALDYAHRQGMIHRDVKPSNILITEDGEPMLTDFGIAKIIDEEATVDLTGTSATVGTPEYMAPEQVISKTVDHRADIYALGVVFYEMVTGRKPFLADTPMGVLVKHASEPLPRPGQFVRDLPESVESVLLKALVKKPDERYTSMGEMAKVLESLSVSASTLTDDVERKIVDGIGLKSTVLGDTHATINQERTGETVLQEDLVEEPRADVSEPVKIGAVPNPQVQPLSVKRMVWLPWVAGLGGLLGLTICLAVGMLAFPKLFATSTLEPFVFPAITEMTIATEAPAATEAPPLEIGSTWVRPVDGMLMMYVPESDFSMGISMGTKAGDLALEMCRQELNPDCQADWLFYEQPEHTVFLDAYWVDQTEVTNGMYALCVQAGVCQPPRDYSSETRSSYYDNLQFINYPVIYVDWSDAQTYCEWVGARLPTEAEWEKVARGTSASVFPWGNNPANCSLANFVSDTGICEGDTSQVGNYPDGASSYNVYDLAGNVMEWVSDWSGAMYTTSAVENPQGPTSGDFRTYRGGSWNLNGFLIRSTNRGEIEATFSNNTLGFRCVRTSP